jgi:hypothetical protein
MVARDDQEVVARNGKRLWGLRWRLEAVFPLQIAPQFDIGKLETIIVTRRLPRRGKRWRTHAGLAKIAPLDCGSGELVASRAE